MRPRRPREGDSPAQYHTAAPWLSVHSGSVYQSCVLPTQSRPWLWRNGEHFKFMLNLRSDGLTLVFDPTPSPAGSLDRQGRERGRRHIQMSFFTPPREGAFQPASHFSAGG